MTKKRSAKNAFISSLVMLCLCVTMLVGTTFAWYTDSVTSGRNTIVAGSLDMTIEVYTGATNGNAFTENWATVGPTTKVFTDDVDGNNDPTDDKISFEPGAARVAYVRVKNSGDLAFKYSLAPAIDAETPGTNQAGQEFYLSNFLYFRVVELNDGDGPFNTRAAAIGNDASPKKITEVDLAGQGHLLEANETSKVIALVIYMPETTGNAANPLPNAKPNITFGLNAVATQYVSERDSFDNTYDANAVMPAVGKGSVVAGEPTVVNAGENKATVPTDAVAGGTALQENDTLTLTIEPAGTDSSITIDDGNNATSYEVSLVNQNGEKVTSATGVTVELNVGQIDIQGFYHGNVELGEVDDIADLVLNKYYYDPAGGKITFITNSFSPFTAEYKYSGGLGEEDYPYLISSADDFYAIANDYEYISSWNQSANDDCYKMTKDITIENWCMNVAYVMKGEFAHDSVSTVYLGVFDGGNHTLSFNWNDDSAMPETNAISLFGEIYGGTIKNLTVDCDIVTDLDVGVLSSYTYYGAQFDNVTVSGTIRSTAGNGNLAAITLAAWEPSSSDHGLFKDCTVSADIYWVPVDKQGYYLYIAPYISQMVGGSYLYFENCTSSGSLNIPYNSTVTDIYTGSFYAQNGSSVPAANINGLTDNCTRNIYEGYTLHIGR